MNYKQYIPKDKFDEVTAQKAVELGYDNLKPIMPDLLEWHQDMNWPVARVLKEIYRSADQDIIPHLNHVLKSNDMIWKYCLICDVLPILKQDVIKHFIPELNRLKSTPTKVELHEELDDAATETLLKIKAHERLQTDASKKSVTVRKKH